MLSGGKIQRIAVVDCQLAGISGDMLVGALLDLGADVDKTIKVMESVKDYVKDCNSLQVTVTDTARQGFHAKRVEVKAVEEFNYRTGIQLRNSISRCVKDQKLSKEACKFALNSIDTLIKAEAKVHKETFKNVQLYEAGSIDTLADIIGAAVALQDLGVFKDTKVYSTPAAVGGGLFKFRHGTITSPAPATIEILRSKKFMIVGGPIEAELTTPTGAALLVNLASATARFYPPMAPIAVGYGAGAKDFEEIPNVVRAILGKTYGYGLLCDEVSILETNLDDVTGEIIGYTIDKILEEGAKDVSVIPMVTKKNRSGCIVKVIADRGDAERLSRVLIEETGTLGVRIIPCYRHILKREVIPVEIEIDGNKEQINVKVATDKEGKVLQIKPEYEDVKRLADKTAKPLRVITDLIMSKLNKLYEG